MPEVMSKITTQLTRKVGPLPVWGWGAIGAAGILVIRSWSRNREPGEVATDDLSAGMPGLSGFGGSPVSLPAGEPPPGQPAFGENLYLSLPYGDGYLSLEGSPSDVTALFGLIPWTFDERQQGQTGAGTEYYVPPPINPAPSPVMTFADVTAALSGPTPGYIPTPLEAAQLYNYVPGNVIYESPAVAGAAAQILSKPAANFLATQNQNCIRIKANPEWYTPEQVAACG
jgi:hypothetical protein